MTLLHFLCVWPTIQRNPDKHTLPTPHRKAKVWGRKPLCFRVTVYLSGWHSTFETHNHKTKIYSQGSGSTSVSLVLAQQLPTGQSREKHHESRFANMLGLESFAKKMQASWCDSLAAGRVQSRWRALCVMSTWSGSCRRRHIHPGHKSCKVQAYKGGGSGGRWLRIVWKKTHLSLSCVCFFKYLFIFLLLISYKPLSPQCCQENKWWALSDVCVSQGSQGRERCVARTSQALRWFPGPHRQAQRLGGVLALIALGHGYRPFHRNTC